MTRDCLRKHCEAMCKKFENDPTSGTYGEHKLTLDLLNQTEWTPVSERLPEDGEKVLVTYDKMVISATWDLMRYRFYDTHAKSLDEDFVYAWMSLPEPYKTESEEV